MKTCLMILFVLFTFILFYLYSRWYYYYGSIDLGDIQGIYLSKLNNLDTLIIVKHGNIFYYMRKVNKKINFGYVSFDEKNKFLNFYLWQTNSEKEINDNITKFKDDSSIYGGEMKRNLNGIEINPIDANGDEIENGYGYKKISDHIPEYHKQLIEKYILDN